MPTPPELPLPHRATTARRPRAERRAEIAAAVLRLIGERGAPALTAARIADAVGLTSGALFRHFASVEEMLEAAVDLAIELALPSLPAPELAPRERLRSLLLERSAVVLAHPGLAWVLLSDQARLALPPAAIQRLDGLVQRTRAALRGALSEGLERGDLRRDVALEQLLPICVGTVHALVRQPGLDADARAAIVDGLLQLLAPVPAP